MEKEFVPVLGDIKRIEGYIKENKYKLQHFIDIPIENPEADLYFSQYGPLTVFEIISPKSQDEFEQLVPDKIDRHDTVRNYKMDFVKNIENWSLKLSLFLINFKIILLKRLKINSNFNKVYCILLFNAP